MLASRSDAAVVISDSKSRVVYANEGFTRAFGWELGDIIGRSVPDLLANQPSGDFLVNLRGELRAGRTVKAEQIIMGKEGHRYWTKIICNPVMDAEGQWQYTTSVLLDITSTKIHEVLNNRVLEAMARDLPLVEVLEMVCEEVERIAPEIRASILEIDAMGSLRSLAGPSPPESYSTRLNGVVIGPKAGSCGTAAWRKEPVLVTDIATDPLWDDYRHLILPLGYNCCWSTPILDKDGRVMGTFAFYYREYGPYVASPFHHLLVQACTYLCVLAMERERTRQRIRQLAYYDGLTGLPSRSLLEANSEQMLLDLGEDGRRAAVLFIDLDRFKHVNDSLGHAAGDQLLCAAAELLKDMVRRCSGIAGRLSGDEFVVVLPEPETESISALVERLLAAFRQPFVVEGTPLGVSASIGIAMFPDDGQTMETLLRHADIAMYQAKRAGRGRFSSLNFHNLDLPGVISEALVHNRLSPEDLTLELTENILLDANPSTMISFIASMPSACGCPWMTSGRAIRA